MQPKQSERKGPDHLIKQLRQVPIQAGLAANLARLEQWLANCSDLVIHQVSPPKGPKAAILFLDGLVDKALMDKHLIEPLLKGAIETDLRKLAEGTTSLAEALTVRTYGDLLSNLLSGDAVLLVDGTPEVLVCGVRSWQSRAIAEPVTEAAVRGPREGFVETLRLNTAMLRRRVKSPAFKLEAVNVGRLTETDVVIGYIEGIADSAIVDEVKRRIGRIEIDGVLEGGYIEQYIEDSPLSPFPQVQNTERPDVAAAALLEGRVLLLVDGTPFVLIVPVVFSQFMQASEDYYERFLIGSAVRGLRYLFLLIALAMPSLYIAIITFHQEMLPTDLLLSIAGAREGVPFPALVEALAMEIAFEILREAGIRLPKTVGQAVSIVGALVVGDAAVRAGIVSPSMVIVVATTGIASFAIPRYNAGIAIRMLRFPLMFLAGSLGLFGVVAGMGAILLHLCSLRSFGIPYLSPLAPLDWRGMKDTLIRAPLWWMRLRPPLFGRQNTYRQSGGLKPGSQHGPGRSG